MVHPLLAKFQGALLGAACGSYLSHHPPEPDWVELIMAFTASLIQHQALDLDHWGQIWQKNCQRPPESQPNPDEAALIAFPVALFFHENRSLQQQQLQQLAQIWPKTDISDEREGRMLAIGNAIAQVLQASTDTRSILPQILEILSPDTYLHQQLTQVHIALTKSLTLTDIQTRLSTLPYPDLALGFYCFLSTPSEPMLTLGRAARINPSSQLITILSAILSGAHNSLLGIPVPWRLAPFAETQSQEVELLSLSQILLNTWSGIDPSISKFQPYSSLPVVQAP